MDFENKSNKATFDGLVLLSELAASEVIEDADVSVIEHDGRAWFEIYSNYAHDFVTWEQNRKQEMNEPIEGIPHEEQGSSQEYSEYKGSSQASYSSSEPMTDPVLEAEVQSEKQQRTPEDQLSGKHMARIEQFLPECHSELMEVLQRAVEKKTPVRYGWCKLLDKKTNKGARDEGKPLHEKVGYIQLSWDGMNHVCCNSLEGLF
jgi:hypothetical protein